MMAYHSRWSDEDGGFVGYVDEFPSLSWIAPTEDESIDGIRRMTAKVVADMLANGESVPCLNHDDTPVDGHTE